MRDEAGGGKKAAADGERWLERAADFHRDACTLLGQESMAGAPARLCAIHAIELYLSAFLAHRGMAAGDIKKMGHNLAVRAEAVTARGLVLRRRTGAHLVAMTVGQEYVALRYRSLSVGKLAPASRMVATLAEVSEKVTKAISRQG